MPEVAAGGPIPSAGRIVKLDPPEAASGLGARDWRLKEPVVTRRKAAGSTLPTAYGLLPSASESRIPYLESRRILWGWYEPTERARELIQNREYRYISPAIDWT